VRVVLLFFFFFQAEDGIRDSSVTGVQTCALPILKDRTEWNGTDIVFEISRKRDSTEVRFTHVGLVPAFECYGACSAAWGFYINEIGRASCRGRVESTGGAGRVKEKDRRKIKKNMR